MSHTITLILYTVRVIYKCTCSEVKDNLLWCYLSGLSQWVLSTGRRWKGGGGGGGGEEGGRKRGGRGEEEGREGERREGEGGSDGGGGREGVREGVGRGREGGKAGQWRLIFSDTTALGFVLCCRIL